ncbi:hypothetical protein O181_109142 [Austropuccinia psidii MF-1]|uniref:Uncharacterized protein n=1 Tax=Austropuccinia psidii MF-1 TaxID=1389203 RepID=A0A9Q3JVK0_9BASI|nr:hypothetical protein [Austropuccinia psidii MF-1]
MPVHHSPPAKNTRSQRISAVLTPTARAPLDRRPSVHQLSANLDRGPPTEGEAPSRRGGMKSRRSRSFSGLLGGYPGVGTSELEYVGLPPTGRGPPTLVNLATSLCLETVTEESRDKYPFKK